MEKQVPKKTDVAIVGGGPGGMSAAVWCADLGLSCILIDRGIEPGGQLRYVYGPITNYPGVSASNGIELAAAMFRSVQNVPADTLFDTLVTSIDIGGQTLTTDEGAIMWKFLLLATGVRRRTLGVPGEDEFAGKGIISSGVKEANSVAGKKVAVIGGGDAAFENAIILSRTASRVYLIHRRSEFSAREEFHSAVVSNPSIEVLTMSNVVEFRGTAQLGSIIVDTASDQREIAVDHALIRIGVVPNSEMIEAQIECDDDGYILVDRYGQTSDPKVFAVGDIAWRLSPTIATAVGSASAAVKKIRSSIK